MCLFAHCFSVAELIMAQWDQMKLLVQRLPNQTLNELYPPSFPMDVRHYLANWIEDQPWYGLLLVDLYDIYNFKDLFL